MSFENMTVRSKLAWAFGSLTAVVLVVSAIAVRALGAGHSDFASFVGETSVRLALTNEALDATNARAVAARNLVLVTSPSDRDAEKAAVTKAHEKVVSTLAKLKELLAKTPGVTERERQLFAEIERVESRYGPVALDIVNLALTDKRDEAIGKMNSNCRPLLASLIKAANDYLAYGQSQAEEEVQKAQYAYETNRNLLVSACLFAVVAAIWLAFAITRNLIRALGAEPAELSLAAQRVAQGDLGPVAQANGAPSGSVIASLGDMQASLAKVVAQVRNASDSIATGSSQIASGNADLSQRTEEQASNLQETAASMEQMNATVKNNADTARQANQLATSASAAAAKGGDVVGQVVATMQEIASSSKKIVDIIGVIDGIAFQTNILALNAAVESARAGEHGRGFAVVASEVRTLAQRSAEAAKEIKTLIGASVDRVEAGSKLVGEAGANMSDIVTQVKRVADLIGEISSATNEQTTGIGQVSNAVSQLDQVTQQNAALVEESAAAAESLKHQASMLAEVVSVFKLYENSASRSLVQSIPQPANRERRAPIASHTKGSKEGKNTMEAHSQTEWETF